MKKVFAWLLILVLMLTGLTAQAATPYRTWTLGTNGELVETQTAYDPVKSMVRFGDETLRDPQDLRLGPDGNLYVADNGNRRVLVITKNGDVVKTIGDNKTLRSAMGVYVDESLNVYVADDMGSQIVVFDKDGALIRTYGKPTHQLYGEKNFNPTKVVLDKRGNLYVTAKGNTKGIVQISPVGEGEFLGYYGANNSNISLLTRFRRLIFGENSAAAGDIRPSSVANLAIDEKGMVYTVTSVGDTTALRKLNVAGRSTMVPDYVTAQNSAVAVNKYGSIFTATSNGNIMEYTSEGKTLFLFGAFDRDEQRIGTFKDVTGLVVMDDYTLYVLDANLKSIQILKPTEFTDMVHQAFTLFNEGKYAASKEPWTEVLRMNSMFTYASTGLGEAQYREEDYEAAMESFRNGGYRQGYSDAWWEQRSNFLHQGLSSAIIWIVVILVALAVIKYIDRRKKILNPLRKVGSFLYHIPIVNQVLYSFEMLRNPYDACYGIKREKRASILSAILVLTIFFVMFVAYKYFAGFLFKRVPEGYYEVFNDFMMVYGVFMLLTICCYLVCTITDGEARFRDLFISAAYALIPMIVVLPIELILSNVLTFNEEFFISLLNIIGIGWTCLLLVLMLMYQNDYTLGKTIKTIFITMFCVLVVVALIAVMYMLISQLVDFITSVYGEVVYRFVRKV